MSRFAPLGVGGVGSERERPLGAQAQPRAAQAATMLPYLVYMALGAAVASETVLLLIQLVPLTTWATLGFPDGPIPHALLGVVAGIFYVLPTLTGALSRRWQWALVLATLPAWLDLLIFSVATAGRFGAFYVAQDSHAASVVGTLELFAALGTLGWVARAAVLHTLTERASRRGCDQGTGR